ncbi:MAG: hypothetical protein M1830_010279 [Pleopsidium flavum]|nr:MAG: hypothetical protein M1830_010279 [Pleopsidium flavum]
MYCSTTAEIVTLSYRNLIATGSIASPPSTISIIPSTTSTTAPSSNISSASPTSSPSSTPVPAPTTSSGLSKGAIAGISLAGIFLLALLSALLFYFCIRPKLARIRQIKRAGGFSSNNRTNDKGTPLMTSLDANREYHECGQERGRPRWRWGESSGLRIEGAETARKEGPWSPTSILQYPSSPSELHDQPSPRTPALVSTIVPHVGQDSPTIRHVMEESAALGSIYQSYAPNPNPHYSLLVSELSSPTMSSPHTSTQAPMSVSSVSGSRPTSETFLRMSARGGGRGYLSPEMAIAGGWRDDGDGDDVESGDGDGEGREGDGDGVQHVELDGSRNSGGMDMIEEDVEENGDGHGADQGMHVIDRRS